MDQEVEIINSETRKEKIKNFIINKKNTIISILIFLTIVLSVKIGISFVTPNSVAFCIIKLK